MRKDKDNLKIEFIKRRSALVKSGYIILSLLLLLRLFKLQIIDGLLYKKKARNNSMREEFLLPKRGTIYDRYKTVIVSSVVGYKAMYYVGRQGDMRDIRRILELLRRPKNRMLSVFHFVQKKMPVSRNSSFVIARNLSNAEIKRLKFHNVYIPKLFIEKYYIRRYYFHDNTSPLIGSVSSVKNRDDKIARLNSDYKVGVDGIEMIHAATLDGRIGMNYNIVNVSGVKTDTIEVNKPVDGRDIITTIDQELQNKLSSYLDEKNGAATLLDVRTGEILAMVSRPNIDPNLLAVGVSEEEWGDIIRQTPENSGLFMNKNLSATYPPGSTFKIVSSLTGLMSGIDPYKKFRCTGKYKIGNRIFHCWKKEGGHGWVDLDMALAQSCNCYFYHLSQQVINDDVHALAKQLGFERRHLTDFNNEAVGLVGNARWLRHNHNQQWMPGDNANLVLGQGWTHVTPIQLAVMVARLASGKAVEPRYMFQQHYADFYPLGINEEHLQRVRHGLFSVINNPDYGLIYGIAGTKYQVCGKTGSAQVVSQRIDNQDMKRGKVAVTKHSHALFVGFAPFDNPKYAVSVVVEHGIGGARSAAPAGTAILVDAIKREKQLSVAL